MLLLRNANENKTYNVRTERRQEKYLDEEKGSIIYFTWFYGPHFSER